jgi:hypothetical protein
VRYALTLTLTLALCFTAQSFALRAVGGRTTKSESNYFSSIGRIQAGTRGRPEAMLLGSSITGRLPDRAQGFDGWANMGCDGGSAVDALRAMDERVLPNAPLLVIEANTLHLALDTKPTEISQAMRGPWFRVGMKIPLLSAYARPAAFFYSKLLARRIGGFDRGEGPVDLGVNSRPETPGPVDSSHLTDRQNELIAEVTAILERLRQRNISAVIVWLPPARTDASPPPAWILDLSHRNGIPYWDLGQVAAHGTVTLTDGVHMTAPSAARTMVSLLDGLR